MIVGKGDNGLEILVIGNPLVYILRVHNKYTYNVRYGNMYCIDATTLVCTLLLLHLVLITYVSCGTCAH